MKQDMYLILGGAYKLFLCRNTNGGTNIGINSGSPPPEGEIDQPWYKLGDWNTFKNEVEKALQLHAQAHSNRLDEALSKYSVEELQAAIDRRIDNDR